MTRRCIQAHSSNGHWGDYVTKVPFGKSKWIAATWLGLCCVLVCFGAAQTPADKPAEALYLKLGQVGLDAARVYKVRGASLTRSSIQITLDDGMIGFTQDVMGRITGAFFVGEGEILLPPPDEVERKQMGLFTGMAILEERFGSGYFRFNDDTANELMPDLRETDEKKEFVERWSEAAKSLASTDAMRLLLTFSQMLPGKGAAGAEGAANAFTDQATDRYLHARLQGLKLGVFEVYFDSRWAEPIQAGQARTAANGDMYYDVWTSFSPSQSGNIRVAGNKQPSDVEATQRGRLSVVRYAITTEVMPPKIHALARMECELHGGGDRMLFFELSRFLEVQRVTLDGQPVEFIHNPALEGTQLARNGNDIVAVVLPEALVTESKFVLEFEYGGEVLAEAGGGLLYVGARGTWYPNRGRGMADFDLQFSYPQGWTLVATGKSVAVAPEVVAKANGNQTSRWLSDRPLPLAGFNLGKFREVTTRAGNVPVETYASEGVEKDFPNAKVTVMDPNPADPLSHPTEVMIPSRPSPVQHELIVGEEAAHAIQFFSDHLGPYPYSHLALTQIPGRESQGWPGLVYLSSFAFLDQEQREQLHFEPYRILLQKLIPAHETAHQWWGDLIPWTGYRDQWYSEGLAQYCALMMLQEKDPAGFHTIMEQYRRDLVLKDKDGMAPVDAGPVTLGTRLLSSRAPTGYEAISYGRGTWLFHMLRAMLLDAEKQEKGKTHPTEEPFTRALRKVRQRYEGRSISTQELLDVFAEDLPPALRYEGKKSLDWFFAGWINGTAMPKLELKAVKFTPKDSGVLVNGTILQQEASNDLITSVPVYAVAAGKQPVLLGRVFADGEESTFRLSAPPGTHKIVLDPYDTVLTRPK